MLTTPRHDVITFLHVVVQAERLGLMGNTRFQGWAVSSFMRIKDGFQDDVDLRTAVMTDVEAPWLLCCALVSLVGELGAEHGYSGGNGGGNPLLTPETSPNRRITEK